jgi:hypothetical protein
MSTILKRHCYHSNGNDVIFVNNFQLLKDCSMYVVQFLSSNKKTLFKKLNLTHDFVIFQKLYWATLRGIPDRRIWDVYLTPHSWITQFWP